MDKLRGRTWGRSGESFMASGGIGRANAGSISERLKAATDELQKLEKLVVSGDCAPRVLNDFRGAVDSMRQTAWAVQQWTVLQEQHRDPYSVLGILQEERVRRAAQISRDLTLDLESMDLELDTAGLADLFHAIEGLYQRLAPLFRKNMI
jgi:hypothetical protein